MPASILLRNLNARMQRGPNDKKPDYPHSSRCPFESVPNHLTLAEIEAAIVYWRGKRKGYFDLDHVLGEKEVNVLEVLYLRLVTERQGGMWAAQLSDHERRALSESGRGRREA